MGPSSEKEIGKELQKFLKNKFKNEEIENNYKNLTYIDKGTYGIVFSTIDQNKIKYNIPFLFSILLNIL